MLGPLIFGNSHMSYVIVPSSGNDTYESVYTGCQKFTLHPGSHGIMSATIKI